MYEVAIKDSHQTAQSRLQTAVCQLVILRPSDDSGIAKGLFGDGVVILADHLVFISLGGPSRGIAGPR